MSSGEHVGRMGVWVPCVLVSIRDGPVWIVEQGRKIMMVWPMVSKINGKIVAAHNYEPSAPQLANLINKLAGAEIVEVGEPFEMDKKAVLTIDGEHKPVNPPARQKDPNGAVMREIVADAQQPRRRTRKAATADKPATGTATRRAPLRAKPATDKATAGKPAAKRASTAKAKADANA